MKLFNPKSSKKNSNNIQKSMAINQFLKHFSKKFLSNESKF
jgi:hypothetical protein